MGCAVCKSQVDARRGVFLSSTNSSTSTSSKNTESNESSRSNKTTEEHEKRASQIAIQATQSERNESSRSPSFDDHSPFLARYGIKKRTVSSARLKKDEDVWNKYRSTGKIMGSGISGEVRVIEDKRTHKKYALKTLLLKGVKAAKTASLHNEVAIFLQLDHPNIAKLFEVYETVDAIHMVMELCLGKELYDRLYEKKRYSEHDAANVTQQMLSAINYCHNHMICHRDLKLENWVYADGSEDAPLKLIDFGFSRIFNPGIPMTAMHGTVYYVSPEVMEGSYVEKCDLWSIGVIVYMLLSGSPPFNGAADHEILLAVKRGRFSFNGPRWEGTSNDAKKFICRLLQINPDLRPSAAEALQDPWLTKQKVEADSHVIDVEVLATLKVFADGNRMKRAALALLAYSSSPELTSDIEKQFLALDTLNTGSITLHEMVDVLTSILKISESEAHEIFSKLDQTGDQRVHYSEFIATMLNTQLHKNEDLILEAFTKFDVDGTGTITPSNLRTVLGATYDGVAVEDIVRAWDTTGQGALTYEDFEHALLTVEEKENALFNETLIRKEFSRGILQRNLAE